MTDELKAGEEEFKPDAEAAPENAADKAEAQPGTEEAPETPAAGDAAEESPEERAHRLEVENARLQGERDALLRAKAEPEKDEAEELDRQIAEAQAEADKLTAAVEAADGYDDPAEAAKAMVKVRALDRKVAQLERQRDELAEASEQSRADAEAHESAVKAVMSRADVKLPPSAFNALDTAVRERLARENKGHTPSRAHYDAVLEAEALKLKGRQAVKPGPGPKIPKPSAGGGKGNAVFDGLKPGKKRDVLQQMSELGIT